MFKPTSVTCPTAHPWVVEAVDPYRQCVIPSSDQVSLDVVELTFQP